MSTSKKMKFVIFCIYGLVTCFSFKNICYADVISDAEKASLINEIENVTKETSSALFSKLDRILNSSDSSFSQDDLDRLDAIHFSLKNTAFTKNDAILDRDLARYGDICFRKYDEVSGYIEKNPAPVVSDVAPKIEEPKPVFTTPVETPTHDSNFLTENTTSDKKSMYESNAWIKEHNENVASGQINGSKIEITDENSKPFSSNSEIAYNSYNKNNIERPLKDSNFQVQNNALNGAVPQVSNIDRFDEKNPYVVNNVNSASFPALNYSIDNKQQNINKGYYNNYSRVNNIAENLNGLKRTVIIPQTSKKLKGFKFQLLDLKTFLFTYTASFFEQLYKLTNSKLNINLGVDEFLNDIINLKNCSNLDIDSCISVLEDAVSTLQVRQVYDHKSKYLKNRSFSKFLANNVLPLFTENDVILTLKGYLDNLNDTNYVGKYDSIISDLATRIENLSNKYKTVIRSLIKFSSDMKALKNKRKQLKKKGKKQVKNNKKQNKKVIKL